MFIRSHKMANLSRYLMQSSGSFKTTTNPNTITTTRWNKVEQLVKKYKTKQKPPKGMTVHYISVCTLNQ